MLTGAARRGAASVGSLLIAAVPSSPIESDGFPTSSWCGARRRRLLAGGFLRVGMSAVVCYVGGIFLGGQPRMGVFVEATRADGDLSSLWACNDRLSFGSFTQRAQDGQSSHPSALRSNSTCCAYNHEPRRGGRFWIADCGVQNFVGSQTSVL